MKLKRQITTLILGLACGSTCIPTRASVYQFPITITPSSSQFSIHEVIYSPGGPVKTVWDPGNVSVQPTTLRAGDIAVFDFTLNRPLTATDLASNPDASEMIYWAVSGSGTLSANATMEYDWQFLDASGALLSADIPGTGVLRPIPSQVQGVINVSQTFRTLNLTDSSFAFSGIRLSMVVPSIASGWTINWVRLSVAADEMGVVPEPTFGLVGGMGLVLLIVRQWRPERRP